METHAVEQTGNRDGHEVTPARYPARDFRVYIVDRPEEGMFTIDRALFVDPELFELEMKYIFEGTWVYLAHESQLPRPHDFYTTSIGRQPVVLMRNQAGEIGCFVNTCPHRGRGARVVRGRERECGLYLRRELEAAGREWRGRLSLRHCPPHLCGGSAAADDLRERRGSSD